MLWPTRASSSAVQLWLRTVAGEGNGSLWPRSLRLRQSKKPAVSSWALASESATTTRTASALLIGLARAHQVDEIIVNTLAHDPVDRLRSYELLAEAFQLAPKA
ncbi:hypothetical protein N4G69_42355 [Streptomyces mirabilis]|uniref:hypothetical protein n=1 Tax=Streptomyces mirabilis TaxID=68239 RepID=UPI0021BE4BE8|nr:hypothetical protein [Streptomyces mirabilis]MCT9112155.1 hypothetical protein [Streptomyces mirabilis]